MDKSNNMHSLMEAIVLQNDNGKELQFTGKLFSESRFFDEESKTLTILRLYLSREDLLIYSIVTGAGENKSRRFYTVKVNNDECIMSDGTQTMCVPVEMLFASVFGLCGIDPNRAEEFKPMIEETLKAVNLS